MLSPPRTLATLVRLAPFRNAYLRRGLGVWILVRMGLAAASVQDPDLIAEIAVLGVVALAVRWDARRRAEDLFLANLGIPGWAIATLAIPMAAIVELFVP